MLIDRSSHQRFDQRVEKCIPIDLRQHAVAPPVRRPEPCAAVVGTRIAIDRDDAALARKQCRPQQRANGAGIVDRTRVAVAAGKRQQRTAHPGRPCFRSGKACDAAGIDDDMLRQIVGHDDSRYVGIEHIGCRMRIEPDIKLGFWRDIAAVERTPHDNHPVYCRCARRSGAQHRRNICQWPNRAKRQRSRGAAIECRCQINQRIAAWYPLRRFEAERPVAAP
jgi:hypothetical protein